VEFDFDTGCVTSFYTIILSLNVIYLADHTYSAEKTSLSRTLMVLRVRL